jgi:arylsulfatase A-like enzyme
VIFILIDDMGWTDLGCYGSKLYKTPAIDQLASEGVKFTQAYACHPMCVASRVGIMSGKYPARNGVPGRQNSGIPLPLSEITIPEALKEEGYETFFAGKWHLGVEGAFPEDQGFDINIAGHSKGQPDSYFYPYKSPRRPEWDVPGLEGGMEGEYLTDRLTDETITFIKNNHSKPFFVFLSHYAVHVPLQAKPELVEPYREIIKEINYQGPEYQPEGRANQKMHQDNPVYAAMIESIDQGVAEIMKTLDELSLTDNTLIIFTSDNGGESCKMDRRSKSTTNFPLRAGKCWLYEGGIRVPLIVKGPGISNPGTVSAAQVTGMDHFPSILEMAGLPQMPEQHLDGVSYASVLQGMDRPVRKPMFWHFPTASRFDAVVGTENGTAVIHGDFKLIEFSPSGRKELYNLENDIEERNNLYNELPRKAREMHKLIKRWKKETNAPLPIEENK